MTKSVVISITLWYWVMKRAEMTFPAMWYWFYGVSFISTCFRNQYCTAGKSWQLKIPTHGYTSLRSSEHDRKLSGILESKKTEGPTFSNLNQVKNRYNWHTLITRKLIAKSSGTLAWFKQSVILTAKFYRDFDLKLFRILSGQCTHLLQCFCMWLEVLALLLLLLLS